MKVKTEAKDSGSKLAKGKGKLDLIKTNEKLQKKTTLSCNKLKQSRSFAKKPKQVKLELKSVNKNVNLLLSF